MKRLKAPHPLIGFGTLLSDLNPLFYSCFKTIDSFNKKVNRTMCLFSISFFENTFFITKRADSWPVYIWQRCNFDRFAGLFTSLSKQFLVSFEFNSIR